MKTSIDSENYVVVKIDEKYVIFHKDGNQSYCTTNTEEKARAIVLACDGFLENCTESAYNALVLENEKLKELLQSALTYVPFAELREEIAGYLK